MQSSKAGGLSSNLCAGPLGVQPETGGGGMPSLLTTARSHRKEWLTGAAEKRAHLQARLRFL